MSYHPRTRTHLELLSSLWKQLSAKRAKRWSMIGFPKVEQAITFHQGRAY